MLISCDECSKEISSKAASCPSCGAPVTAPIEAHAVRKIHPAHYSTIAKYTTLIPVIYVVLTLGLQFWFDTRRDAYIETEAANLRLLYPDPDEMAESQEYLKPVPKGIIDDDSM